MLKKFLPDRIFDTYENLTPEFLKSEGIRAVISDIDNTLAPYEVAVPDEKIKKWVSELTANGIKVALISNNNAERVELFNRELKLHAYPDSKKPGTKNFRRLLQELGATEKETAVLGDQIFTDVLMGKRCGIKAYIVPPINDKKSLFFKFKRLLEKPIIKAYYRKKGEYKK